MRPFDFGLPDVCGEDRHDRVHNLILDGEDVLEHAVVALGPAMCASCGID